MIKYFQNRFALSEKGAKSFLVSILLTTLLNIAMLLPAVFVFLFLTEYLRPVMSPGASISNGFWYYVSVALVFMAVIYIISLFQYTATYTKVYTESANLRISVAEKLRKLPLAFFGEKNLSDLTSTVMEDCTALERLFSHAVPQLFASVISVLIATGLFFYDWRLALALFWVAPVAALLIFFSKKAMNKSFAAHYVVKRGVTEQIQEGLEQIQEIKAYNGERAYLDRFDDVLRVFENGLIRGELLIGVLLNGAYILLKLGLPTVIGVGAYLLSVGEVSIFSYLIFLMISSAIYNPLMEVFNNLAILSFLDVRINRMREIEGMPVQQGRTQCKIDNYDIVFDCVNFSYEAGKQVLCDVSFTARQGEVTALVGPSGGGKTTCAKLAARFGDVDSGTITLGGQDISEIDPEALLKNFSIVFQDVVLFNATIADNIRIGKKDATDEEVKWAAEQAQCGEFIGKLPEGYDTLIGENGETLSGGERQRISIARALLKDAPVVLLDEATASLDVENESKIQQALSVLVKNRTVLIIAHRMRTVGNAHKIVVLKEGRVAEQGTPLELLARYGEFAAMVKGCYGLTEESALALQ